MPSNSSVDLTEILVKGGEQRVALLRYCVMSVTMEPLFVFLTHEYRLRPGHSAALALYDIFCAPDAPARIRALEVLPPRNLSLLAAIQAIRQQWAHLQRPEQPEEGPTVSITTPHRNLFDLVAHTVRTDTHFTQLASRFDPRLSPQENMPNGRMNAAQRHFVEKVWRPAVRPRLVAAGFWQIASIE
jgi:hypothetical protein